MLSKSIPARRSFRDVPSAALQQPAQLRKRAGARFRSDGGHLDQQGVRERRTAANQHLRPRRREESSQVGAQAVEPGGRLADLEPALLVGDRKARRAVVAVRREDRDQGSRKRVPILARHHPRNLSQNDDAGGRGAGHAGLTRLPASRRFPEDGTRNSEGGGPPAAIPRSGKEPDAHARRQSGDSYARKSIAPPPLCQTATESRTMSERSISGLLCFVTS